MLKAAAIALSLLGSLVLPHALWHSAKYRVTESRSIAAATSCSQSGIENSKIGGNKFATLICAGGDPSANPTTDNSNEDLPLTGDEVGSPTVTGPDGQPGSVCEWYDLEEPPDSARWAGHTSSEGRIEGLRCGAPQNDGTGMGSNLVDYRFVPDGTNPLPAVPPPPPNPAILAEEAYRELVIPQPAIGAGPDRTKLAVSLWTWLWVDNPGQLSVTVAAGGVSVSATASLATVTWTLGEPATQGDTYQPGSPATITCQGAGTAPPAAYDWKAQPPCGYKYHWRSLKERTGSTGTWPITATTNWTVTWQSNTGVTGGTTLNATSNDQFDIGEYRTVLVQGGDGG